MVWRSPGQGGHHADSRAKLRSWDLLSNHPSLKNLSLGTHSRPTELDSSRQGRGEAIYFKKCHPGIKAVWLGSDHLCHRSAAVSSPSCPHATWDWVSL